MTDPHRPGTPAGTDPAVVDRRAALAAAGEQFSNIQDVARTLGLGTEQQRF